MPTRGFVQNTYLQLRSPPQSVHAHLLDVTLFAQDMVVQPLRQPTRRHPLHHQPHLLLDNPHPQKQRDLLQQHLSPPQHPLHPVKKLFCVVGSNATREQMGDLHQPVHGPNTAQKIARTRMHDTDTRPNRNNHSSYGLNRLIRPVLYLQS